MAMILSDEIVQALHELAGCSQHSTAVAQCSICQDRYRLAHAVYTFWTITAASAAITHAPSPPRFWQRVRQTLH